MLVKGLKVNAWKTKLMVVGGDVGVVVSVLRAWPCAVCSSLHVYCLYLS